jgi:hypothetical protein
MGSNPESRKEFETITQSSLPTGRKGKHHRLLAQVLDELPRLTDGRAIRIPLAEFPGSVADIRSAIHRATKKLKVQVATSSDDEFFYLWKPTDDGSPGEGEQSIAVSNGNDVVRETRSR